MSNKMKKLLLPILALLIASPAWSAQQNISTITTKQSRNDMRSAINTELGKVQSNTTELYSLAIAAPWLAQDHAPSITNVFWVDTSGASPVIKYWDGDSWEVAASGEDGSYTLPTASSDTLGGVKVGARLTITDGVLSADVQTGEGSMVYPGAGVAVSTGSAWGTSLAASSFLVGDCTVGPCLDGTSDGGTLIKFYAGTGSYWTALQGGVPAANRSWRLPIAAAPSTGTTYLMNMDEYGQMGFVDPATFFPAWDLDYTDLINKPTIPTASDTTYDATIWNGSTDVPTKNAVRDVIEALTLASGGSQTAVQVPFTPNGSLAATNTQAAVQEVRDETQPISSNLTALAAIANTTYGRSLLALANAAALQSAAGLVPGTNVQAYSANLSTYAGIAPSANVQAILGAANYAGVKALLDVDDLNTLSGVGAGSTNLGTFTGTTIADNTTVKGALQSLETVVDSAVDITAGTGITISSGAISVTAGTYVPKTSIDTQAKFEAYLGWTLPTGGTGTFAFDTYPAYKDSAHSSGIAVNGTTLAVYSPTASKWLTVALTDSLGTAPVGCTTGNILEETFNTAVGGDNTWTTGFITGGGTADLDFTAPALAGFSGQAFKSAVTATADSEAWKYWVDSADRTTVYGRFYLDVTANGFAAWSGERVFGYGSNDMYPTGIQFTISKDGSGNTILGVLGDGITAQDQIITTNASHRVEFYAVNNGATDSFQVKVDGVTLATQSGVIFSNNFRRMDIGFYPGLNPSAISTILIDKLAISSTGWLGACD